MNKKTLAVELSKLKRVDEVNADLEQYATDSEVASSILWQAFMEDNIEGKIVADLGCGNGIFGVGALILGANIVYFVDIDEASLKLAKQNCKFKNCEFINSEILEFDKKVDSVIMNPPFGVQNEHADRNFLEKAMEISDNIYSIHKIESGKFIEKLSKENGFEVVSVQKIRLILRKTMKFHKKEKHLVEVGIWRLKRKI